MHRILTATELGELLLEELRQLPADRDLQYEVRFCRAEDGDPQDNDPPGTWRIMVGFGRHLRELGRVKTAATSIRGGRTRDADVVQDEHGQDILCCVTDCDDTGTLQECMRTGCQHYVCYEHSSDDGECLHHPEEMKADG